MASEHRGAPRPADGDAGEIIGCRVDLVDQTIGGVAPEVDASDIVIEAGIDADGDPSGLAGAAVGPRPRAL